MILRPNSPEFREMVRAYMVCILWTMPGPDNDENPGDRYTPERFTKEARIVCAADCLEFLNRVQRMRLSPWVWQSSERFTLSGYGPAQFGHDLALSRNGHGAGFFDRDALSVPADPDIPGSQSLGDVLQEIAREMGERSIVNARGWIHCE